MSSGASTNPGLRGELARLLAARNLKAYLAYIWERYFADVPRVNEVQIAYCRPWKSRLGLIRMSLDETTSFIGINALLQHELVPEYVLITTVAHELAHYAHGFGSPLPRLYAHPHANNVVNSNWKGADSVLLYDNVTHGLTENGSRFMIRSESWVGPKSHAFISLASANRLLR